MSDKRKKPEISWFGALCDDDYEFLGVVAPELTSSWDHCRDIVLCAEENGFDNILLPSGYELGIDATSFASAISVATNKIRLLLAVRMGEMWLPQLARQMATIDQMSGGRLTINVISSELPGQKLESEPRYKRTREYMKVLRQLLNGNPVDFHGQFVDLEIEAPRVRTVSGHCPLFYFGGFSEAAKETAAMEADVFLTWPDTVNGVESIVLDMKERALGYGRELKYGLRAHVIVRETEKEARNAANRLIIQLDDKQGEEIRNRSLDAVSVGVSRQTELRENSDNDGFIEENLWTGVGRARSGAGAAIVGDPDQVKNKINAYMDAGINAFILSGYPHISECELFGTNVLNQIEHGPLA